MCLPKLQMLHKGDVLLEFDGVTIANDGTVHLRHRERIYFSSLVTQKPSGGTAVLKVRSSALAGARFDCHHRRGSVGEAITTDTLESIIVLFFEPRQALAI